MAKGYQFHWSDGNNQCGYNLPCVLGKQGKFVFKEDGLQGGTSKNITIAAIYGHDVLIQNDLQRRNNYFFENPNSYGNILCGGKVFQNLAKKLADGNEPKGVGKTILIKNGQPSNSQAGIDVLSFGCEKVITVYPYYAAPANTMGKIPFYKLISGTGTKVPAMYIDERGYSHWFGNYLSFSNGFHLYNAQSGSYATRWVQGLLGLLAFTDERFLDDPYLLLTNGSDREKSAVSAWDHRPTNPLLMPIVNPPCALLQAFMTKFGGQTIQDQIIDEKIFHPAFDSDPQRAAQLYQQFKDENRCRITVPPEPEPEPGTPELWAPNPWAPWAR